MRQIRNSVFETNSSSVHSICISKNPVNISNFGSFVRFEIGEYGWENATVCDTASYLYTAVLDGYEYEDAIQKIEELKNILDAHNIKYEFEDPEWSWSDWNGGHKYFDKGYIDHAYDTHDFVEAVLKDEDMLMRYLFGDSWIYTGNDNQETDYERCYIADEAIEEYDRESKSWIFKPNPYHDAENYDYFYKGN